MTHNEKMLKQRGIVGIKQMPNGAIKFIYARKPKRSEKSLGCKLGDNLKAMHGVRVCHNTKG